MITLNLIYDGIQGYIKFPILHKMILFTWFTSISKWHCVNGLHNIVLILKNVRKLYLLYLYLLIKQHNRHKWGLLFVLLSNKYWCYWRGTSVGYLLSSNFNPMRSTCQLVKWNILSFIEPIRESVRKVVSCASLWGTVVKALSLLASQMNNLWCQPIRIYVRRPMMLSRWVKDVFNVYLILVCFLKWYYCVIHEKTTYQLLKYASAKPFEYHSSHFRI